MYIERLANEEELKNGDSATKDLLRTGAVGSSRMLFTVNDVTYNKILKEYAGKDAVTEGIKQDFLNQINKELLERYKITAKNIRFDYWKIKADSCWRSTIGVFLIPLEKSSLHGLLTLIRHVECEANLTGVYCGTTESNITPDGIQQLEVLSRVSKMFPIDKIYSSPSKRCMATAEAVLRGVNNGSFIRKSKELMEFNGGKWENMTFKDIAEEYAEQYDKFMNNIETCRAPKGDYGLDKINILSNYVDNLDVSSNTALVTHGGVIRLILSILLNEDPENINWVANASVTTLKYKDGAWKIVEFGDTRHLPNSLVEFKKNDWRTSKTKKVS